MSGLLKALENPTLFHLRNHGRIGEDEYHVMHNDADAVGEGFGLDDYEVRDWRTIDSGYEPTVEMPATQGSSNYSPTLHRVIESLVSRGLVIRDEKNPIILEVPNPVSAGVRKPDPRLN